jgi:hypothetical protein
MVVLLYFSDYLKLLILFTVGRDVIGIPYLLLQGRIIIAFVVSTGNIPFLCTASADRKGF